MARAVGRHFSHFREVSLDVQILCLSGHLDSKTLSFLLQSCIRHTKEIYPS